MIGKRLRGCRPHMPRKDDDDDVSLSAKLGLDGTVSVTHLSLVLVARPSASAPPQLNARAVPPVAPVAVSEL